MPRKDKMPKMDKMHRLDETVTKAKKSKSPRLNKPATAANMARVANGQKDQGGKWASG